MDTILGVTMTIDAFVTATRVQTFNQASCLFFVTIRNHGLNPVNIGTKASHLHLLALASLNSQRIRVNPFVGRYIRRVRRVRKDIEHSRFVDDGQVGYHRDNLLEDRPYLRLDFGLWFWRNTATWINVIWYTYQVWK